MADNSDLSTPQKLFEEDNEAESPGRKSPSVADAIAIFQSGGGGKNTNSVITPVAKRPWQKSKITSPTNSNTSSSPHGGGSVVYSPNNNNSPYSSGDGAPSSYVVSTPSPSPNKTEDETSKRPPSPIIKVLEEENEARKREDGFEKMRVASPVHDNVKNNVTEEEQESGDIMEMSDSEAGAAEVEKQVIEEEEDEDEDEDQWEDFMANYWQSSSLAISPQKKKSIRKEDTDLKPCFIEPELDMDDPLSAMRTGPMDIDMDTSIMSTDDEKLSKIGLECSIAMSNFVQEKRGNASSNTLKIHVGMIESRVKKTPKKKRSVERITQQEEPLLQQTTPKGLEPPVEETHRLALEPPEDRHQPPSKFYNNNQKQVTMTTKVPPAPLTSSPQLAEQKQATFNTTLRLASTKSFDAANDDKKSTKSSVVGSDAASSSASEWKHKISPLPDPQLIFNSGPISTRTSLRSLVMKKWHASYWMHYGPHTLLIFRSNEHLDDWANNPYHGKKQRDFLVKREIDFMIDMEESNESGGHAKEVLGHRLLPMKKKSYGKNEEMFQFKLERWTTLGCSVFAAFASPIESEVQVLHDQIRNILSNCPNNGLKNIDHMLRT